MRDGPADDLVRPALARGARHRPATGSIAVTCTSRTHPRLAARLARGLQAALSGRVSTVAHSITTVQRAAEVIHRQLSPGAAHRVPPSTPAPSWGVPDEQSPAAALGGR